MKKHWKYLKYVLRHKFYVAVFLLQDFGYSPGNLWRALIHDLSKFYPSEWLPYVVFFNGANAGLTQAQIDEKERVARQLGVPYTSREREKAEFDVAWNHHQKRNKHHWQYWMLTFDKGNTVCLPMPEKYMYEMIADWRSAGYCITGRHEMREWYLKNRENIQLHPETRNYLEYTIKVNR